MTGSISTGWVGVYRGNSGSPVFDLYQKKFIGMVQSFANDFINVVDKNGQVKGILAYNSGLGKAVSSRVIVKMLEQLNLPQ